MTLDESPSGLATLYADIGRQLRAYDSQDDALAAVTATAVTAVPGVEWASITRGRDGVFRTLAATDPSADTVDAIQYELGSGPCVDAVVQEATFVTGDLRADPRWPEFGRRAADATGVRSMLSFRLFLEGEDFIAGLNLYSTSPAAFDSSSELVGTLVATHGAIAVAASAARERAAQLQRALLSNRDIGVAMGILMANYKVTKGQAFDLLRVASQNSNRKLTDVASNVTDTGVLTLPDSTRPRLQATAGGSRAASRRQASRTTPEPPEPDPPG